MGICDDDEVCAIGLVSFDDDGGGDFFNFLADGGVTKAGTGP